MVNNVGRPVNTENNKGSFCFIFCFLQVVFPAPALHHPFPLATAAAKATCDYMPALDAAKMLGRQSTIAFVMLLEHVTAQLWSQFVAILHNSSQLVTVLDTSPQFDTWSSRCNRHAKQRVRHNSPQFVAIRHNNYKLDNSSQFVIIRHKTKPEFWKKEKTTIMATEQTNITTKGQTTITTK